MPACLPMFVIVLMVRAENQISHPQAACAAIFKQYPELCLQPLHAFANMHHADQGVMQRSAIQRLKACYGAGHGGKLLTIKRRCCSCTQTQTLSATLLS